jgi:hypothetical protein
MRDSDGDTNDAMHVDGEHVVADTMPLSRADTVVVAERLQLGEPRIPVGYHVVKNQSTRLHAFKYGYFYLIQGTAQQPGGRTTTINNALCRVPQCSSATMSSVRDPKLFTHLSSKHADYYREYVRLCIRENEAYVRPIRKSAPAANSGPVQIADENTPLPVNRERDGKRRNVQPLFRSDSDPTAQITDSLKPVNVDAGDRWRNECQRAWAICFATNGIAHRVIESDSFKAALAVQSFDGHFPIPGNLHMPTLNRGIIKERQATAAQDFRRLVVDHLRGRIVTLALDGWKDLLDNKVINILLLAGAKAFYWTGLFCDEIVLSADVIAAKLIPILDQLRALDVRIAAICTDNETTMISMHDYLIQGNPRIPRSPFRHIIHLRDGAHTVNLTVKTILLDPTAKRLMKQLEKTIVVIKAAKRLRVRLSANQTEKKLRLVEPTDTRWNSQHAAMSRFLKLRTPLMAALNADDGDEKCSNRHLVHTDEWWRSAGELKTLLYPFLSAINHLQSDDVSLHTYNRMIEFCRDSLIKAAHPIPPAVANSMTAAAALGLTKYNSLRWKPINNGAQPRQFVRMLFLHLNHGLNGSPRIVWIKPTRIMDNSVSDEYVERQRVADEKSDEATSARIVQWYVCWAADYLINTGDACVGANYPTDGESLKILQNRIYDQWLSFVSGWRLRQYSGRVATSSGVNGFVNERQRGSGYCVDMQSPAADYTDAAVERSFSQEKQVQSPLCAR